VTKAAGGKMLLGNGRTSRGDGVLPFGPTSSVLFPYGEPPPLETGDRLRPKASGVFHEKKTENRTHAKGEMATSRAGLQTTHSGVHG